MDLKIRGLPADDWPGVPGADWGMGSRVEVLVPLEPPEWVSALVIGAVADDTPEGWMISLQFPDGESCLASPALIRSVKRD